MPESKAPQWWYSLFQKGHHDMSVYQIEWAWHAYSEHQKEQAKAVVPCNQSDWERVARNVCANEQAMRRRLVDLGIKP